MQEIARDVALLMMRMANAYLVGNRGSWVLVDSGTPGNAETIKQAAEARFGPGAKPRAIVLTHGHLDHAGSAAELAKMWGVRVYAHRLEWPYLSGRSSYPPMDPTAPGVFSSLSRLFPARTVDLADRLEEIGSGLSELGVEGWEPVNTPGHTHGHVAFFRRSDGVLLTGDAVITMNVDTVAGILSKRKQLCRPPAAATTDWPQARRSVHLLAELRPRVIASGHGFAMADAAQELRELAEHFPIPGHGRYVNEPARADESGITYLPPKPLDVVPKIAFGIAATAVVGGVLALRKTRDRNRTSLD